MQVSVSARNPERAPPEGYKDNPNEVSKLLLENGLSINYMQMRDLALSAQHDYDEHTFNALSEIDDLPSRDLLNLSQVERNAIVEEIHGVQNLAAEESPSIIDDALQRFQICLEEMPVDKKIAYLRAQELYHNTYINSNEWRLRFLRCDFFDANKAAHRMVNFLDLLSDIFGDYVLKRPLQMADFTWDEMQAFRRGHYQLLPYRDRSGRRVFTVVGGFDAVKTRLITRAKIFLYLMLVASETVETQRKGIVSVIFPGTKFSAEDESIGVKLDRIVFLKRLYENLPVRTSSIHVCLPNIPYIHLFRTSFIMTMPGHRKRMKFHSGEPVEVKYALKAYGIAVELIPLTDTGNVKTTYLKQWIKIRKILDESNQNRKGLDASVIECPDSNDVVFRPGTSMSCHPGNVRFRGLLEALTAPTAAKATQAELAENVVAEVTKTGGRFLRWDNRAGYWAKIDDQMQIHAKVALSIRDFKYKSTKQRNNQQNTNSYTFMFCQDSDGTNKRKRCVDLRC